MVVSVLACEASELPEFGSLAYEGDDFEVWASDGLVACEGTYPYMEGWLSAFRAHVGEHGSPTHHRFYWLGPEDRDATPCRDSVACAFTDRPGHPIYSERIPYEHEVVHVELAPLIGHRLLTEGAAEAFGSIADGSVNSSFPIGDLTDGDVPGPGYPSAGRFTRYLLDTYGMDDYFELMHAARDARSRAPLDRAFRSVLDVSVDEAIADYETFAPCAAPMWRYYDYECNDLPLTPWVSPASWESTIALSCDQPDVIGPRGGEPMIWSLRALEVEEGGAYELTVASDEPATANLEPCFVGCFDGLGAYPASPSATPERASGAVLLQPGRHWLRVEHAAGSSAAVTVALRRL